MWRWIDEPSIQFRKGACHRAVRALDGAVRAVLLAIAYLGSSGVFQQQASAARAATLTFRADMLSEKLAQLRGQAESIARIEALQQDLTNMKSGWKTVEKTSGDAGKALIDVYVTRNPNPADKRELLVKVDGPSGFYFSSHEKTQSDVQTYLANGPFSDLLMADAQGNIIYSYKKHETFARNVASGDLAKSGLGTVYSLANKAVAASKDGETAETVFSGLAISARDRQNRHLFRGSASEAGRAARHRHLQGRRSCAHRCHDQGASCRKRGTGEHPRQ